MNILKGTRVYTCGALQFGNFDNAVKWRQVLKDHFSPLGIKVLSPMDEVFHNFPKESEMSFTEIKKLLAEGDHEEAHAKSKVLRNKDLAMIDNSTFIIAVLEPGIPTYGTIDEILTAKRAQKPVFLVINGGYKNIPVWLASYFKPSWVYSDLAEVVLRVRDIDSGKIPINTEYWRIFSEEFR